MAAILYTYKHQLYANITNKCNCSCILCIRNHADTVGSVAQLWHQTDPGIDEIKQPLADSMQIPLRIRHYN